MLNPDDEIRQPILIADDQENLEALDPEAVWLAKYEKMSYKELAERMLELKKAADTAERSEIAASAELDVIRLRVVPNRFAEDGLSSMNIAGVGRLGLTKDAYCTQRKDADQSDFFQWLRDNEYGDLIKDTVNPSSLKSLVKELAEEEMQEEKEFIPGEDDAADESKFEQVQAYVKFTPFMRAAVTKR